MYSAQSLLTVNDAGILAQKWLLADAMLVLAGDLLKKDPLLLPYYTFHNETVSVGNIAVSLHTLLRGGVLLTTQYSTCHVLPKFQFFGGRGYS